MSYEHTTDIEECDEPRGCTRGNCGWPPLAQDSKYKLLILVTGDYYFFFLCVTST